jgi:hypothetical protein
LTLSALPRNPRRHQELRTPTKDRVVTEKLSPIHGVVMGAGERSYLMRDNQIDVMRVQYGGGVEDTGLSFRLTPPPSSAAKLGSTPTLTPSKALLMDKVGGRGSGALAANKLRTEYPCT